MDYGLLFFAAVALTFIAFLIINGNFPVKIFVLMLLVLFSLIGYNQEQQSTYSCESDIINKCFGKTTCTDSGFYDCLQQITPCELNKNIYIDLCVNQKI